MENITIGITFFNSKKTINQVIESANRQGCQVLIADNGENGSIDGAIQVPHEYGVNRKKNIVAARKALIDATITEYHFILDGDVLLPDGAVNRCYELFQLIDDCGCVGIKYASAPHIQMGATLWKTEIIKSCDFSNYEQDCTCVMAKRHLDNLNLRMVSLADMKAIHLHKDRGSNG